MPGAEFAIEGRAATQGLPITPLFAEQSVFAALSQPKEVEIYDGPKAPITVASSFCGRCVGVAKCSEKTHPVSTDIFLKPATRQFDCLLEASGPDKAISQLGKAPANHRAIVQADVNFKRFT